jgi:hypothetical protein
MSSAEASPQQLTPAEKLERKKEKMKNLQREKPDPVAEAAAKRAEEERIAEERRLAKEAEERIEAARREAEDQAAREEAEMRAAEEAAARRVYERAAAAEERRRQAWLSEEAKKVMFGRHVQIDSLSKARDSSLLQGSYMRYLVVEENWQHAERARADKEELLYRKEENAATWSAAGKARAQERSLRQQQSRKIRKEMEERSRRQAREARKELEASRRLLQRQKDLAQKEMRERVRQSSSLLARLDAVEEASAEQQRKEGAAARAEVASAVAAMRLRLRSDKQQVVAHVRSSFAFGSTAELTDRVVDAAARRADKVRKAERAWKRAQSRGEQSFLEQAREKRAVVVAQRGQARAAVADALEDRKMAADDLRNIKHLVAKEAMRQQGPQREAIGAIAADVYRARFASKEAADAYDHSEWMNLTGWFIPSEPPPMGLLKVSKETSAAAAAAAAAPNAESEELLEA